MLKYVVLTVGAMWTTAAFADTNAKVLEDFLAKAPNASKFDPLPAPAPDGASGPGVVFSPAEAVGGSGSALDNLKEQQLRKSFEERQLR